MENHSLILFTQKEVGKNIIKAGKSMMSVERSVVALRDAIKKYAQDYALEKVLVTCRDLNKTKAFAMKHAVKMFPEVALPFIVDMIQRVWEGAESKE